MSEMRNGQGAGPPLLGLRVIDISNFLAAPSVSMWLGDFGAEVIKVERPGTGDEFRKWGHEKDGVGLYFKVINRNKKSVTADLHDPIGVEIVKRLIRDADVVIENYRPGTLEKWGLGYDVLSEINPKLIMLRLTGYGQYGPNKDKPGFGTAMEAFSGSAYISGSPDGPPMLPAFGLADSTAGLAGAFLTLVAVRERDARSGKGQVIDLALYEPLFSLIGPFVIDFDQLGIVQERAGSRLSFTAPRNVYRCADGRYVSISGSSQGIYERLCRGLDVEELIVDPRFADHHARMRNVVELDAALGSAIERFPLEEVLRRLDASGAVVAAVRGIDEILVDPHVVARENVVSIGDDELHTTIRMQNVAGKFSRTPGHIAWPGPAVGQHNAEILIDRLGFGREELESAGIEIEDRASSKEATTP